MKLNKKNLALGAFFMGISALQWFSVSAETVQDLDADPSLLTPEIEKEIEEYASGVIATNTFEGEFTETLPFFNGQFNQFKIDFSEDSRKSYKAGERLDIKGTLSFTSEVENNYLDFKKNCLESTGTTGKSRCLLSPTYLFRHYPETGLFAQIWQRDKEEKGALKGDFLIDEFFVLNGVDLKENDRKEFTLNWKTWPSLANGSYYISLSVINNQNFELFGTPLLAGAPNKIYDFKIENESEESQGVVIDKNEIKIQGLEYTYRAPAPEVVPSFEDDSINVEIPIVNENKENKVSLHYELYRWGQTDNKNLLDSKEESRLLKSNERFKANYKFTANELDSVYNLKLTAKTDTSLSTTNIRFVIKNRAKGVFRFIALAQDQGGNYPFFCLKNANWNGIFQGTVSLELKDSLGNLIHSAEQKANIRPETRCFIALDQKVESNECLVLKGKITDKQGRLIDEKEFLLPCGSDKSSKVDNTLKKIGDSIAFEDNKNWILIFVFILFILVGSFIYLNNKKKNNED
mgnify:CR=1 FL=1